MLTVIFSTYNGEDTLPLMLDSLTCCTSPEGGWHLVAVDNASDDNSLEILESYQDVLPLTILREQRRGKNYALNTAIDVARGDLVVFTDDDVIVDPDWLVKYQQHAESKSEISIFGGYVAPFWETAPAKWILDWVSHAWVFALTPPDLAGGVVSAGYIFGPNMAIRKSIFDQGYRYDTTIGPNGSKSYIMGSETSFTRMLEENGFLCCHVPDVKVSHIIRKYQLNRKWVLSRAVRAGRGKFIAESDNYKENKRWNHVPTSLCRLYLRQKIRLIRAYIFYNRKKIFTEQWNSHFTKGKILQSYEYFSK
jgi:glycosyltransferase involved in cell wall biosynthesis